MMRGDTDFVWKIVMGGSGGVGKTTILYRYVTKEFVNDTKLTVGVQFHNIPYIERHKKKLAIILWDLGGQQRFRFIMPTYVKGAAGGFIVYDMSRFETLTDTQEWINLFKEVNGQDFPVVLVGTKYDLLSDDEAKQIISDAEEVKNRDGYVAHVVTSAKLGYNVDETIQYMIDYLLMSNGVDISTTDA
jgi:small GTP-binding protein